jgi:hypothetical protein
MIVDWKKYKRFFAFGCSFTGYMWPTWADIISKEMPDTKFYNFGLSGAGNPLISYRLAEANNRFKFTDTDLVMVMFTTYCREDRWVEHENGWVTKGNVYNNPFYPDDFIKKYADERGYLIRDAAVIDMAVKYLEYIPATTYSMLSVPFVTNADSMNHTSKAPGDIREIYKDTFSKFKPSIFELELRSNWSSLEHDYPFDDGHPAPNRYYNYLEKLGFNLTDKSKQYALEVSNILKTVKSRNTVPLYFPEQDNNISESLKLLF